MKALFYTREFPPYVYGGAGVHVEYLASELNIFYRTSRVPPDFLRKHDCH